MKHRAEFLRVADTRRRAAAPGLVLQARDRDEPDGPGAARLGFTVSRKVGNAVERNRARRRLRAAAERIMPAHAAPGHDFVLIGRRETLSREFGALLQDLEGAMKRLRVWRGAAP